MADVLDVERPLDLDVHGSGVDADHDGRRPVRRHLTVLVVKALQV